MEGEHFLGTVSQKAIIEKDGEVLVCRGVGDAVWEFPGGRLHANESPREGMLREIQEELGITLTDVRPFHVESSVHLKNNMPLLVVAYRCACSDAELQIDRTEIEEYRWVSREVLKDLPMFEAYRMVADAFLNEYAQ